MESLRVETASYWLLYLPVPTLALFQGRQEIITGGQVEDRQGVFLVLGNGMCTMRVLLDRDDFCGFVCMCF